MELDQVTVRAPGPGWGILALNVTTLERLGFVIAPVVDADDPVIGHAHVLATPPAYDEDGQIPLELREAMAASSAWVREPLRG